MFAQVEKPKENISRTIVNSVAQRKSKTKTKINPLAKQSFPSYAVSHNVPNNLNSYQPVAQLEPYNVRERGAPPYGWLTGLAIWLNKTAGKGNWAFTGSFAMYCWAWVKDGKARAPNDIDILVKGNKFSDVAYGLNDVFEGNFSPPGSNTKKSTVKIVLDVIELNEDVTQYPTHIDILREGARFGSLENIAFLGDNFPVTTIADMTARKESIQSEFGNWSDPDDVAKTEEDLLILQGLADL